MGGTGRALPVKEAPPSDSEGTTEAAFLKETEQNKDTNQFFFEGGLCLLFQESTHLDECRWGGVCTVYTQCHNLVIWLHLWLRGFYREAASKCLDYNSQQGQGGGSPNTGRCLPVHGSHPAGPHPAQELPKETGGAEQRPGSLEGSS